MNMTGIDHARVVEVLLAGQWHIVQAGTFTRDQSCTQFVERGTGLVVTAANQHVQAVRSEASG